MVSHDTPFVATIVVSLAFAYAGGIVARIAGLPNIVGYILAGIFVGPHTPGFTADQKLTAELAEIGVALLMFAIGLHFSPRDLLRVWHIAVPGALLQVSACTLIGFGAVMTREQVQMIEAWQAGRIDEARALGKRVQRLADVVFAKPVGDYRVRLKECLRLLGVLEAAHVRRPLMPIGDDERAYLARVLAEVGLLPGVPAAAPSPAAALTRS